MEGLSWCGCRRALTKQLVPELEVTVLRRAYGIKVKRAKQKPPFGHDMNFSILFDKTAEDKSVID